MTAETLSTLSSVLTTAQTVVLLFPKQHSVDVVLSAVALGQVLESLGKHVTVCCPGPVAERLQSYAGVAEVRSELGNKNLDVSFPYQPEQVDKVSYHIDEEAQRFHLVIQPRKGTLPLDASAVTYELTGAEADLIITFAVDQLDDLEQLYIGYEELYETTTIVSLHSYETAFGNVKFSTAQLASYAEAVAKITQALEVQLTAEPATNLLTALESATQTFRSLAVTADTFTLAGQLLQAGARRKRLAEPDSYPAGEQRSGMLNGTVMPSSLNGESSAVRPTPALQPIVPQEADKPSDRAKGKKSASTQPSHPGMRVV